MKFKTLISLLLTLSLVLFLISCNETPPIETTTGETTSAETTAETTSAEPTTTEPTTSETTTEETTIPEETYKKGMTMNTWRPEISLVYYPWTITLDYEYDTSENYDIEIIADIPPEGYPYLPETITMQITNKTGVPIKQYGSPHIEIYERTATGGMGAWVRIPYINEEEADAGIIERESSYTYEMVVKNGLRPVLDNKNYVIYYDIQAITNNNKDEDARCRIVLYLDDGPHYVEFLLSYRRKGYAFGPPRGDWPYGTWKYSADEEMLKHEEENRNK